MISPWERYEDFGKVWKERRPLTIEYLKDVSIYMQDVDVATSRCHDEGPSQKVISDAMLFFYFEQYLDGLIQDYQKGVVDM